MAGCSSSKSEFHAAATASLQAQKAQIITRPTEYSYQTIGTASGEATQTTIFGFYSTGDNVSTMSVLGMLKGDSSLEKLAAFRAIKTLKGDAFYKLSTEESESGFFVKTRTVKVTGKVLRIHDNGPMDLERIDKLRETTFKSSSALSRFFD